jgi:hypothetical protein
MASESGPQSTHLNAAFVIRQSANRVRGRDSSKKEQTKRREEQPSARARKVKKRKKQGTVQVPSQLRFRYSFFRETTPEGSVPTHR